MSTVPVVNRMDTSSQYCNEDLHRALDAIYHSCSSTDVVEVDHDCRHIYGYKDGKNHELSMLQKVTATVWLDYERYTTARTDSGASGAPAAAAAPSMAALERQAIEFRNQHGACLNLKQVIQAQAPRMALAAEFKRASPSKGDIACDLDAGQQAVLYGKAGANIISCLTERRWFKGSLQDMTQVRLATTKSAAAAAASQQRQRPAVLRKEFVTTEYMIAEAAAAGADTVLLIVAVLPETLLKRLIDYSRERLGMEPLVEVHADAELEVALRAGAQVIGVNNRNLHTFQVDLATSERVADRLTAKGLHFRHGERTTNDEESSIALCALSGMSTCYDVDRFRQAGLGMCLIGESLMRAADPAKAIESLCLDPADFAKQTSNSSSGGGAYTSGTQIIKVCGITQPEDALAACRAGANLIGVIFAPGSKRKVTAEQASRVVAAVHQFGERRIRTEFPVAIGSNSSTAPIPHLVASARVLAQVTKQRPAVVGVFQNQDVNFIRSMVDECGLDLVQLHGAEGMAAANRDKLTVPALRVVDIAVDPATGQTAANAVEQLLESLTNDPAVILLDTSIKGVKTGGGTGVAFDWTIAERLQAAGLPVIVAGGLKPETVQDCVGRIRPFGVDVSSGVEAAPGQKDHDKVRDFVQGARTAAAEASKGF